MGVRCPLRHRLNRIKDQVGKNLLELVKISDNSGNKGIEFFNHADIL